MAASPQRSSGSGLLAQLGLDAARRASATPADAGDDPVARQHETIAGWLARIDDRAQRDRLAGALARLRSTHAAGRTLRDGAKQAVLRRAELDAAARLLEQARQSANAAAAAPAAPRSSAPLAAPPGAAIPAQGDIAPGVPGPGGTAGSAGVGGSPAPQAAPQAAPPPAPPAAPQAAAPTAAPLRTPPPGMLRRQIDGEMFWEPNPAPPTWGTAKPPPAPDDWVRDCLGFFGIAPNPAPGAAQDSCVFNAAVTPLAQVAATVNEQADLSGYAANSSARSIAAKLLADQSGARQLGQGTARKIASGDASGVVGDLAALDKLEMPALIAALEQIRGAGGLDRLALVPDISRRVAVAIGAVRRQLDPAWVESVKKLRDADGLAVRRYAYGRILTAPPADEGSDTGGAKAEDLGERVADVLKAKRDLAPLVAELARLEMRAMLVALKELKQRGCLDPFADRMGDVGERVGAAVLTVKGDWDSPEWRKSVAHLSEPDREAILAQTPANIRTPPATKAPLPTELAISIAFVPKTTHQRIVGKNPDPDPNPDPRKNDGRGSDGATVQIAGTFTFKFHGKGQHGFEGTPALLQGSLTYDEEKNKYTAQVTGGAQGAAVLSFFNEAVQAQAFVQALAGATIEAGKGIETTVHLTGQVAAGGQVVLSHPGLMGGNLKLVLIPLQVSGTATDTRVGPTVTLDTSAGIGLQLSK